MTRRERSNPASTFDQVVDRAQQQAGAGDEHHRERDFRHHESAADQVPGRAGSLDATLLERRHQLVDPRVNQRREPEHGAGGDRQQHGEQQDGRIDRHLVGSREAVGIQAHDGLDARAREDETERAAEQRQQDALGHELAEQPSAAGAERGADRELPASRLGAGDQQVREVGAGDQEHERDRSLEDPDRPPGAADNLLLQRLHLQPMSVRGVDVLLHANALAPVADERLELVRGSRRRHAVLEAADQIQEVIAAVLAIRRVEAQGQPDLGPVVHDIGARRQDADHLAVDAVDFNGLADHRPAAER